MALIVVALLCAAAAAAWARPDRLMSRMGDAGSDLGLRTAIWSASVDVARQYPVAGVGAGAFPSAMTYYQPPPRDVFFNHAHNQYLEFITEGGWLLGLPMGILLIALGVVIVRRIGEDTTSFAWLRVGACAGLAGLAVMALWESPFRTPATLMIAAVAAGLAASEGRR